MRLRPTDIGIVPLLLSFPFMFFPKVLGGDTQPWVLSAALIAFFTFRTEGFLNRRDAGLVVLACLSILAYASRSAFDFFLLRHVYTYVTFVILWIVCQRAKGDYFPLAVKATVIIWFVVGLYQYVAINLGYAIETPGRYLEGRMGPPSLTPEASYYGSLSILQLMYILSLKEGKNAIFVACAMVSVVLSGSVLSLMLLVFAFRKLVASLRARVVVIVPLLVIGGFYLTTSGLATRLSSITAGGISVSGFLLDASVNLRAGHLYFTLFANLVPSLLLAGPIDFMTQYNSFAADSGVLIATGTNYILPAIGEMIYGAGIVAALLLLVFLKRAQESCGTRGAKVEKIAFIVACMLNPITIANVFLILYAQAKGETAPTGTRNTRQ